MSVVEFCPPYVAEDLAKSGLVIGDMRVRPAGGTEKQATNTPLGVDAYVIPYFDMWEKPLPFYRTKLINNPDPDIRYKQLATEGNHVYFPVGFSKLLKTAKYIILTEGEKKAAKAVKEGFPCVAFGGVDSWRNRTITLHKDATLGQSKSGAVVAKLPAGSEVSEGADVVARGFQQLIDYAKKHNIAFIIAFDVDAGKKDPHPFEVQRAAATLGFELRNRGMPFNLIKQLILSPGDTGFQGKLGLDDFLVHEDLGSDELHQQIYDMMRKRTAFPRHPNVRQYVSKKLQRTNITRTETQSIGIAIISDLDSKGTRLHCPDNDQMYYFDEETHRLLKVSISSQLDFSKTPFGIKCYTDYGISSMDYKLLAVMNAQYCAEQPVQKVKPERVLACRGDNLYYQISDGLMVKVNAKTIEVMPNGSEDVLFEGDLVNPVPHKQLTEIVASLQKQQTLECYWYSTLQEARVKQSPNDYTRRLLALLYSISPWFYRWRGTQLPVEQMLGEAGSGKSTLFELRQMVTMGITNLRNAPQDLRGWTASIANSGGLHVTDNVHMVNSSLKQQLSDELCRVITETDPHIEARKLYTDNDLIRVPVKVVFAITAIKQPFTNTDIIQRSIITELDKGIEEVIYDADWKNTQLKKFGGRVHWVANQLVFMQRMFQLVEKDWQPNYKAKFRLVNVEQLLVLAAKVFGWEHAWLPNYIEALRDEKTATSDAAIEGLICWAEYQRSKAKREHKPIERIAWTTQDMAHWFEAEEDFAKNTLLTNARSLGHYIEGKKNTIAQIAGIVQRDRKVGNRHAYQILSVDED